MRIGEGRELGTFTQPLLKYSRDQFPDSLQGEELKRVQAKYRGIPEEFYTETQQGVVTPYNFSEWFGQNRCEHSAGLFQFQEYWS